LKGGKDLFQIWMKEESDLIQSVSRSYGESICLEQFIINIHALKSQKCQEMFTKLAVLFALNSIQRDLAWFMAEGIFLPNYFSKFQAQYDVAVAAVAPIAMDAVAAFDVREEMLNAPIAADWVKYNTYDNQGTHFIFSLFTACFNFLL
jgi:acyl-CoA oxidase